MPLISDSIPSLVNGVSQQAASLRLRTQSEAQENAYPSLVEGLKKRPPTEHIAKLTGTITGLSGSYVHFINRDANEQYAVVIKDDDLFVYDLQGNEKTVAFPDGKGYLNNTTPQTGFSAITVADFTFIVNKNITAAMSGSPGAGRNPEALIFVKLGEPETTYTVDIDGTQEAAYTTTSTGSTYETTNIATELYNDLNANLGANFTVTRIGNVIHIEETNSNDFDFDVSDGFGGRALIGIKESVQDFSDLPPKAVDGFVTRIIGDDLNNFDDYYVTWDETNKSGVWEETVKPGLDNDFDASTMPHQLVRESDGTFTFSQISWASRGVGDINSAPKPSFIDRKINDVFFFRNRLGFLSDENVIMSRHGDFFAFWPETVTTLLDSDRIDVAGQHNKVSILYHAVPYNKQLLLFSEQSQFVMDVTDSLTPETAALEQTTEFNVNVDCRPVGVGTNVYFTTNQGNFSRVREFFITDDFQAQDASDVTAHVPKYVPDGVHTIAASQSDDILFFLTSSETQRIYAYKFFWGGEDGQEKLQSAWGRWTFETTDEILGAGSIKNNLYLVILRSDGLYLEKMNLQSGLEDTGMGFLVHLDRKTELTGSYDAGADETTWTLPYSDDAEFSVVLGSGFGNSLGDAPAVSKPSSTTIKATGDYSAASAFVGRKYEFEYEFSEQVVRQRRGSGEVAVTSGKLVLKNFQIAYDDTGFFIAEVVPQYRDTYTYKFSGIILGQAMIGTINILSGTFRFPVGANSKNVTIKLTNDTHLPCTFQSAEWEGQWFMRSRRR